MTRSVVRWFVFCVTGLVGLGLAAHLFASKEWVSGIVWPEPKVVTPGEGAAPPSDAIVLFDGRDLAQWEGSPWFVKDGAMVAHKGEIHTKRGFGSCQLHVEFAEPEKIEGAGQGRGNSGVFLMNTYEVQVLDSYQNATYFDGQCAAIYKQHPPLVNVCRKPGQWQSYDILFEAPKFADGKLKKPAYITVLQNGVVVHNHFEIQGITAWDAPPSYKPHADKLPIGLQFHGNPVKFRNIWIRELP